MFCSTPQDTNKTTDGATALYGVPVYPITQRDSQAELTWAVDEIPTWCKHDSNLQTVTPSELTGTDIQQ